MNKPEDVDNLCAKCKAAADSWAPVADRLWRESPKCAHESGHRTAV